LWRSMQSPTYPPCPGATILTGHQVVSTGRILAGIVVGCCKNPAPRSPLPQGYIRYKLTLRACQTRHQQRTIPVCWSDIFCRRLPPALSMVGVSDSSAWRSPPHRQPPVAMGPGDCGAGFLSHQSATRRRPVCTSNEIGRSPLLGRSPLCANRPVGNVAHRAAASRRRAGECSPPRVSLPPGASNGWPPREEGSLSRRGGTSQ
jgi:hypothetical protein